MIIERTFPAGAWRISAVVDGYRVERVFMDYTRREAVAAWRAYVNTRRIGR